MPRRPSVTSDLSTQPVLADGLSLTLCSACSSLPEWALSRIDGYTKVCEAGRLCPSWLLCCARRIGVTEGPQVAS